MAHRHIAICDECKTEAVLSTQGPDDDRPTVGAHDWPMAYPPQVEQPGRERPIDHKLRVFCSIECAKRWLHKKVDEIQQGKPLPEPT